jgi:hypothetical protein
MLSVKILQFLANNWQFRRRAKAKTPVSGAFPTPINAAG